MSDEKVMSTNGMFNLQPETLHELQEEIFKWQEYNFGEQGDRRMVMGICEESGELCHAQLKFEQAIRGDEESLTAEAKDAVGDICVYAFNLLSNNDEKSPLFSKNDDLKETKDLERIGDCVLDIFCAAARIETARKMKVQNPAAPHPTAPPEISPMIRHTHQLLVQVNTYCTMVGWEVEKILRETWKTVGNRDWQRFPNNGVDE